MHISCFKNDKRYSCTPYKFGALHFLTIDNNLTKIQKVAVFEFDVINVVGLGVCENRALNMHSKM